MLLSTIGFKILMLEAEGSILTFLLNFLHTFLTYVLGSRLYTRLFTYWFKLISALLVNIDRHFMSKFNVLKAWSTRYHVVAVKVAGSSATLLSVVTDS